MEAFITASVNGIPLVGVVLGLVEYCKRLGLAGKQLQGASLVIGLVLGIGYQMSALGPLPYDWPQAFGVAVYGLGLGLVASGVHDALAAGR